MLYQSPSSIFLPQQKLHTWIITPGPTLLMSKWIYLPILVEVNGWTWMSAYLGPSSWMLDAYYMSQGEHQELKWKWYVACITLDKKALNSIMCSQIPTKHHGQIASEYRYKGEAIQSSKTIGGLQYCLFSPPKQFPNQEIMCLFVFGINGFVILDLMNLTNLRWHYTWFL